MMMLFKTKSISIMYDGRPRWRGGGRDSVVSGFAGDRSGQGVRVAGSPGSATVRSWRQGRPGRAPEGHGALRVWSADSFATGTDTRRSERAGT